MKKARRIKDIMEDIFDYPHLPYWFSNKQAIDILKKMLPGSEVCSYPRAILIFDERYNLLGTLNIRDILRGLEPRFVESADEKMASIMEDEDAFSGFLETLYGDASKEMLKKPVSEMMVPAKFFLEPDDPVTKAAFMMLQHNLIFLPVLEDKKKLVGIVKVVRVFDEITNVLLSE